MLTQIRSQLVPAAACEPASAELCIQSPLCLNQADPSPSLEMVRICYDNQDLIAIAAFPAQSTVSAFCKVCSIPIHPPH